MMGSSRVRRAPSKVAVIIEPWSSRASQCEDKGPYGGGSWLPPNHSLFLPAAPGVPFPTSSSKGTPGEAPGTPKCLARLWLTVGVVRSSCPHLSRLVTCCLVEQFSPTEHRKGRRQYEERNPRKGGAVLEGRSRWGGSDPLSLTSRESLPSFLPLTAGSRGAIPPLLEELSGETQSMEQFMECDLRTKDCRVRRTGTEQIDPPPNSPSA